MPPPPTAKAPKKKFATLGDLRGGGGPSHAGHGHDDDDDDDGDFEPSDDENQNLYAGGEKSGLAVENPDDLKKKIIERAKKFVQLRHICTIHTNSVSPGTLQDPVAMILEPFLLVSLVPPARLEETMPPVRSSLTPTPQDHSALHLSNGVCTSGQMAFLSMTVHYSVPMILQTPQY